MQPPRVDTEEWMCQNCATKYVAPSNDEKNYTLVYEDGQFYWKSENDRKKIPIKSCCEFPYIEELQF